MLRIDMIMLHPTSRMPSKARIWVSIQAISAGFISEESFRPLKIAK